MATRSCSSGELVNAACAGWCSRHKGEAIGAHVEHAHIVLIVCASVRADTRRSAQLVVVAR